MGAAVGLAGAVVVVLVVVLGLAGLVSLPFLLLLDKRMDEGTEGMTVVNGTNEAEHAPTQGASGRSAQKHEGTDASFAWGAF